MKIHNTQKRWDNIPNNCLKKLDEDKRGSAYRVKVENFGFNVIYTKRGGLRGADIHPNTQYDLILKGEFEIWLKKGKSILKFKKRENELIVIPPGTPHLFKCLKESLIIEWWSGPFNQEFYPPFRKYIEDNLPKIGLNKTSVK